MEIRSKSRAVALVGAGVVAGGILAGTLAANAATPSATGNGGTAGSSAPAPANADSPTPVRSDEKALDSALAAKLEQEAEAKTGGTAYRVESDAGDATYEAHVRKADGSMVTVKFDSSGAITAVEDGMGKGDPAPAGGPGHGGPGAPGGSGGSEGGA